MFNSRHQIPVERGGEPMSEEDKQRLILLTIVIVLGVSFIVGTPE